MKSPRKVKWRKVQKGRVKGDTTRGNFLAYGTIGLKALEPERVTARQLEAGRVVINRTLKREGQMFIRVFPDLPVSKKPAEVRMGSGKGSPEYWAARIHPGRLIYEARGLSTQLMTAALAKAAYRMPFKCKIVSIDTQLAVKAKFAGANVQELKCISNRN